MKNVWYKKYWQIGFVSRLYDLLAPEAYRDCLRRGVEHVSDGRVLFDAGCGSGLLLSFLQDRLKINCRYIGTDILWSGASVTKGKLEKTGLMERAWVFQSDLMNAIPLKENSVDVVFAFFLVYTLGDTGKRKKLMRDLRRILKPGGKLIIINPSRNYNARNIIRVSLEDIRQRNGFIRYWVKKWFVYPWTLRLGLDYVESQIKTRDWHAYTQDELCAEVREGGFEVKHLETVYADSAYLVVAE